MRVTLVSRLYDPEPAAASFRLAALVRALAAGGDDVTVLTTRYRAAPSTETARARGDGGTVRVRRWPVLRDRTGYVRGYLQYLSFDVPAFFRVLLGSRAEVVVVEPPPTTGVLVRLACTLRRTPYVYYAADVWSQASQTTGAAGWVVAVLRRLERVAWSGARRVLAVSDGVVERVRELAPRAEVVRVGNGIDTTTFSREVAVDAHTELDPYLVYAGTASEWHGAGVFVEAMHEVHASHPTATLVFVGQGAEWDSLTRAATGLPDGVVRMLPRVDGAAAAAWLRGARASLASVRPGTPYEFAFPTKAYASMACGTPVVYSGAGVAGEEILASGSGWSVPQDPAAVAAAMRAALDAPVDAGERDGLARWAHEHVSVDAAAHQAAAAVHAAGTAAGRPGTGRPRVGRSERGDGA